MIMLKDNHTLDAVAITGTDEDLSFPFFAGLTDSRLSRVGKTTNVTGAKEIVITFSAPVSAEYIAVLNHNITSGATVTISDGVTTIPLTVSDTIICNCNLTSEEFTLSILDGSNPDGYIKVGLVYLGEAEDLGFFNMGVPIDYNTNSTQVISSSGQLTGGKGLNYKAAKFTFSDISETQRQQFINIFNDVDIIKPFILLIWEDSLTVEPPLYSCLMKQFSYKKQETDGVRWSVDMEIREVF